MKCTKLIYALISGLLFFPAVLPAQGIGQTIQRDDSLYAHYEEEQALKLYLQILDQKPDHYRSLWRSSLLHTRLGNRLDDKDKQERYFDRAINLAEQALDIDSTDSQS